LTLPSNFLDWEDDNSQLDIEDEEEIPHTHAELLRPVSIPRFHVFLVSSSSLKIPFLSLQQHICPGKHCIFFICSEEFSFFNYS
jgi:hypothetical protein